MGAFVGSRDLSRQGQHHGDGVLGRGDGVAKRRVHDNDASAGSGCQVNIVNANAGAANDFEVFGGGHDIGIGRVADRMARPL